MARSSQLIGISFRPLPGTHEPTIWLAKSRAPEETFTMELAGKVALVTGAGSGIGKAAALQLAKAGARIGALSHTEAEVRQTAEEIEAAGGQAAPLVADVSDAEEMRQAIERLIARFGRLDVVFANAGINGVWAPIDE